MQLQQKLHELKESFLSSGRATPEMLKIMERSTEDLRASGIVERALKVGQPAPAFTLANQDGQPIASQDLLWRGPLVISFFRGVW